MNGWDALDTALKVIAPSSITAFVAVKVAKLTHSHEDLKERRRRRQDALEAVVELFEKAHVMILDVVIAYRIEGDIRELPEGDQEKARKSAEKVLELANDCLGEIRNAFGRMHSRLKMLGAAEADAALDDYHTVADELVKKTAEYTSEGRRFVEDAWQKLRPKRLSFVDAVSRRFKEGDAE